MTSLPPPDELERICKAIAVLDAILSPEWEPRCFSFDAKWGPKMRMASMRNGSGDDRFIAFTPAGVFFKSFWHEYPRKSRAAIYRGLPAGLRVQLDEPSFETKLVTFGGWYAGGKWTLRGNAEPLAEDLAVLSGDPRAYRDSAKQYFEVDVPIAAIEHVLAGKRLDTKLVRRISAERTLRELGADLKQIGYAK